MSVGKTKQSTKLLAQVLLVLLLFLNSLNLKKFVVSVLFCDVRAGVSAFPSSDSVYDAVWYLLCLDSSLLGVQSHIWTISSDPNYVWGCGRRWSTRRGQSSANKGRMVSTIYKHTNCVLSEWPHVESSLIRPSAAILLKTNMSKNLSSFIRRGCCPTSTVSVAAWYTKPWVTRQKQLTNRRSLKWCPRLWAWPLSQRSRKKTSRAWKRWR